MPWNAWLSLILGTLFLALIGVAVRRGFRSGGTSGSGPWRRLAPVILSVTFGLLIGLGGRSLFGGLLPADKPADKSQIVASLSVGPDGAKANLPDGGYIDIPKGVIAKPVTINLIKRPIDQAVTLQAPNGDSLTFKPGELFVYDLTPRDTGLAGPIELALPVPPGQKVLVFVTADGKHQVVPGVPAGETVRVSITSFDLSAPGAVTLLR